MGTQLVGHGRGQGERKYHGCVTMVRTEALGGGVLFALLSRELTGVHRTWQTSNTQKICQIGIVYAVERQENKREGGIWSCSWPGACSAVSTRRSLLAPSYYRPTPLCFGRRICSARQEFELFALSWCLLHRARPAAPGDTGAAKSSKETS
jgi:hypothetical protein